MRPTSQRIVIEKDIPAVMRDGVTLRANIYRPDTTERLPVLLTRLPYGKELPLATMFLDPVKAASAGYIVVIQDVRGRYRSEGDFAPYINEFYDGEDSVDWASRLPGSDGTVAMFGASYFGVTQWQAAVMRPPRCARCFFRSLARTSSMAR